MTDDLVKRLREIGEGDMYLAPTSTKAIIDIAADRIEKLEAALREIEYLDSPLVRGKPRRVEIYDIARAALGEKKDGNV